MPLHHAVLALLAAKPAHGYELKGSFEQAVGDQWGGLNIGHLYQVLDRLARDGLIDSERQPQPVKPDRLVHRITPAGREELDRWLDEPSVRTRGYRDDFFLKVVAAAQAGDPGKLAGVLRRQRMHLLTELRSLSDAARAAASGSPVVALLVSGKPSSRGTSTPSLWCHLLRAGDVTPAGGRSFRRHALRAAGSLQLPVLSGRCPGGVRRPSRSRWLSWKPIRIPC